MATDEVMGEGRPDAGPEPTPEEGTPLYVHLPYCAAKCHYCDFYSVPAEGQDIDATLTALLSEAQRRAPSRPRSVFLGGGTPSLLSCAQLTRVLDALERVTHFRSSALEVTAECNPESLDDDKARCLLDLGVRRLSIGIQSLHDEVLVLLGRVHSVADSLRAFEAARRAGVRDLNIDVIYALPGQRLDAWERDLERLVALQPEHLSAYNLTFEEETLFRRWLEQGRLTKLPDDDELAFFEHTRRRLTAAGLEPYEVSNYAKAGHQCRHNTNYWHNGDYVGIGPSAVSKIGALRAGNVKSIAEYRRLLHAGRSARAWHESPTNRARLVETWWLGLRLAEGLSAQDAWRRARMPGSWSAVTDPALPVAHRCAEIGLLECVGGRWRLTARGLPLADGVAREFLALGVPVDAPR